MADILQHTTSVCPVCLKPVKAGYVFCNGVVMLAKTCPQHGTFKTKIWDTPQNFAQWQRPKIYTPLPYAVKPVQNGCPYDCGLCQNHKQKSCTVLLEITRRCNMQCAVCFADAGKTIDPSLDEIDLWYQTAKKSNPAVNIQLSGGEPTLRGDLPQIIAAGVKRGIGFIQLNTNGILLAQDADFAQKLAQAGLASVFLQFDGTSDDIYKTLRNQPLMEIKKQAIKNCAQAGLGVVLVPTLVPGVNTGDIGNILHFALSRTPAVKGVHFQPISYFGRYPQTPDNAARITLPELMAQIETLSHGLFKAGHFSPPGCENSLCSMHANYVVMQNNRVLSLNHPACDNSPQSACQGSDKAVRHTAKKWRGNGYNVEGEDCTREFYPANPYDVDLDEFLERGKSHGFMISAMAFQDAWTLDLTRLGDCCVHIMSPKGQLVPFCAYNLTNVNGKALYRDV